MIQYIIAWCIRIPIDFNYLFLVDTWKRQRKLINPAFQPRIFESFIPVFEFHGNKLINILKKKGENAIIDVPEFIDLYVLDTICGKRTTEALPHAPSKYAYESIYLQNL